jgi:hypothetical protein
LHPFQGDFAFEFIVGGEEEFANAAFGMPSTRPEPSGSRIAPNRSSAGLDRPKNPDRSCITRARIATNLKKA